MAQRCAPLPLSQRRADGAWRTAQAGAGRASSESSSTALGRVPGKHQHKGEISMTDTGTPIINEDHGVTLTDEQIENLAHDLVSASDDVREAYEGKSIDVAEVRDTYERVKALNVAEFDEVIAKAFGIIHSLTCLEMVLARRAKDADMKADAAQS
jgi:hypothetical protein